MVILVAAASSCCNPRSDHTKYPIPPLSNRQGGLGGKKRLGSALKLQALSTMVQMIIHKSCCLATTFHNLHMRCWNNFSSTHFCKRNKTLQVSLSSRIALSQNVKVASLHDIVESSNQMTTRCMSLDKWSLSHIPQNANHRMHVTSQMEQKRAHFLSTSIELGLKVK